MPAKVILEVHSGPKAGTHFSFDAHDTLLFGRGPRCHARIEGDPYVSRNHFILEANPPDARIRDLGSKNGTNVNDRKYGGRAADESADDAAGRRYPEVDLNDGDQIKVGQTSIRVVIQTPLSCDECAAEIDESQRQAAEWSPGRFRCADCRLQIATLDRPRTIVEVLRCERCGKDVKDEVGNRRQGQYQCAECRQQLMSESGGLRQLMQAAAQQVEGEQVPDIAGYELGPILGKGGMGQVYHATRKRDGRPVAVKVMLAQVAVSTAARRLFEREIEVMHELHHRNLVRLLDSGSVSTAFYFVMEYCDGGSLEKRIDPAKRPRLPLKTAIPLMMHCLDGLAHAHELGYVHRDLKPQNLLLQRHRGHWIAKVGDFGLAKSFEKAGLSGMTATNTHAGTYPFMPREQLTDFREVRPVSDVWSLAASFYLLISGHLPRKESEHKDPMENILEVDAAPIREHLAGIPAAIAAVIDRALATDVDERFADAGAMKEAALRAIGK